MLKLEEAGQGQSPISSQKEDSEEPDERLVRERVFVTLLSTQWTEIIGEGIECASWTTLPQNMPCDNPSHTWKKDGLDKLTLRSRKPHLRADNRSKKNYNPAACGPKTTVTERQRR